MYWLLIILGFIVSLYLISTVYNIFNLKYSIRLREINEKTKNTFSNHLSLLYDLYNTFYSNFMKFKKKDIIASDFAYMCDLLLTRISDELNGDIHSFREKFMEATGGKSVLTKEDIEDIKGKEELKTKEKLTYEDIMGNFGLFSEKQINQILDEINKRKKDKKNEEGTDNTKRELQ